MMDIAVPLFKAFLLFTQAAVATVAISAVAATLAMLCVKAAERASAKREIELEIQLDDVPEAQEKRKGRIVRA